MWKLPVVLLLAAVPLVSGCMDARQITEETSRKAAPPGSPSRSESSQLHISCGSSYLQVGQTTYCSAFDGSGNDVSGSTFFSSYTPSVLQVDWTTTKAVGTGIGYVKAHNLSGEAYFRIEVTNPPPPAPLTVSRIEGATRINPMDECFWYVSVSGGTPPYTYRWGGDATGQTGYGFTTQFSSNAAFDVVVTDAAGAVGSAYHYVEVTSDQLPGFC